MATKKRTVAVYPWDKWYPHGIGPLGLQSSGGTPAEVTFPTQPLRTKAMIALAPDFTQPYWTWNWADITKDADGSSIVRWEQQIDITAGGRANSAVAEASLCQFRATNDRRFSRRNPYSPYYNQLSEYTPLWVQLDYGQGFKDKYFGFIHDFAKSWDTHRSDPYVSLTARGPLHRIGKSKPLKSPLNRASSGVTAGDTKPYAYWAMEDGEQATFFASATPGFPPLTITNPEAAAPASSSAITGSLPLPVFSPGSAGYAEIPDYTDTGFWAQAVAVYSEDFSNPSTVLEMTIAGATSVVYLVAMMADDDNPQLIAADALGDLIDFTDTVMASSVDGVPFYVVVTLRNNASGTDDIATMDVITADGVQLASLSLNLGPGEYGKATVVRLHDRLETESATVDVMGHAAFYIDPAFSVAVDGVENAKAISGFDGERAIPRLRRVCREENIPFFTAGLDDDSAQCGPQTVGSLINTLRMPEKIDGGTIFEHQFGIGYKSHHEYTNQPVTLTLDASLGQILDLGSPVDNDLDFVNQWTVSRVNGSSATVAARKGEAGVTLTDNELRYESSDSVAAYDDDQLEPIAARYGRHSTVDEDRWPAISFHLATHPELIEAWQAFPFGGRLQALNVYEEVGNTTLDQIHRGHNERWNSLTWQVMLNCAPSSPYNIMELDSLTYGRLDSDSSTLVDDISDSAVSFMVDTADTSEIWTTDSAEFPLDIELYPGTGLAIASGGETMRISSVASFARDTFSRTEVDQWGFMDTGQAWALFTVGGAVADFDVSGGVGTMIVDGANEYRVAILSDIAANRVLNPEVGVTFTTGVPNVSGGAIEPGNIILRYVNTTNYYLCRVEVTTAELVTISLHKLVENAGTALTSNFTAPINYTAQALRVHCMINGSTLRAKVFDPAVTSAHLVDWQVTATDTTFQNAGVVGIRTGVASGNTDVPITVLYDSFEIYTPQIFTVNARSLNGIVKAHKAGTVVRISDMVVIL